MEFNRPQTIAVDVHLVSKNVFRSSKYFCNAPAACSKLTDGCKHPQVNDLSGLSIWYFLLMATTSADILFAEVMFRLTFKANVFLTLQSKSWIQSLDICWAFVGKYIVSMLFLLTFKAGNFLAKIGSKPRKWDEQKSCWASFLRSGASEWTSSRSIQCSFCSKLFKSRRRFLWLSF